MREKIKYQSSKRERKQSSEIAGVICGIKEGARDPLRMKGKKLDYSGKALAQACKEQDKKK